MTSSCSHDVAPDKQGIMGSILFVVVQATLIVLERNAAGATHRSTSQTQFELR